MHIQTIEKWFENYDKWVHQAERAQRLGFVWEQEDRLLGVTYHSIEELDLKAEEMRVKYKEEKDRLSAILRNGGAKHE